MSKHTPGQWMQAAHSPTDIITDEGTMIAMARNGLNGITLGQAVANARLIAAAPDLLEALQAIIGHEAHLINSYRVQTARDAIAKCNI